jgi:hypothetical protein
MSIFTDISERVLADRRGDIQRRQQKMTHDELKDRPTPPDIAAAMRLPDAKVYPCEKCGAPMKTNYSTRCRRCKPAAIGRKCLVCGVKFQSAYSDLCLKHRPAAA